MLFWLILLTMNLLESAMKIRKYVKQRNVSQLPKSVQKIIGDQQDEAGKYELSAMAELQKNAIEGAQFYVDGEHLEIKTEMPRAGLNSLLNIWLRTFIANST